MITIQPANDPAKHPAKHPAKIPGEHIYIEKLVGYVRSGEKQCPFRQKEKVALRRDFYQLQQKVICDRRGKGDYMNKDYLMEPWEDIKSAEDSFCDYDEATDNDPEKDKDLMFGSALIAVAKLLEDIRDELRKINEREDRNNGKT